MGSLQNPKMTHFRTERQQRAGSRCDWLLRPCQPEQEVTENNWRAETEIRNRAGAERNRAGAERNRAGAERNRAGTERNRAVTENMKLM